MVETMIAIKQICGDQRVTREINLKELAQLQAIVNKLAALLKALSSEKLKTVSKKETKMSKLEAAARADPKIASILKDKVVEKVIIVPDKVVNFVLKPEEKS